MKRRTSFAAMLALGAALYTGSLNAPATAAEPAAKISIAVVNMQKVMGEAKPIAAMDDEFKATLADQQKQLDNLYAGRLLDDKDRAELESLQKLSSPSSQQSSRIKALAKISDDRESEMARLAQVEKPTDADRTRMTQLQTWLGKQNDRVTALQTSMADSRQRKQAEVYQRAVQAVVNVVGTLAQERGYEMVVDSSSVLFSRDQLDITDVVLQRLNAGGAPPKPAGKK